MGQGKGKGWGTSIKQIPSMHSEKSLKVREKLLLDTITLRNVVGDMFASLPIIESLKQKVVERDKIIANLNDELMKGQK